MDDLFDALLVWSFAQLVGLLALPLAGFVFARLPTAALGLSRPLGLLVVAYPAWLLASLDLVPYGRYSALLGLAVLTAAALAIACFDGLPWRRGLPMRLWLVGEAIFTLTFAAWATLRSFAPDVLETEKPMDMAIVNAVNRSDSFPPHDPWLSGESLNYYYFGHYVVALLVRTTGVEPAVGYNLGVALFYALVACALFAVAATFAVSARGAAARLRTAVIPGLLAVVFAVALGNLAGARELWERGELAAYNWFAPSRVIAGTANEFPFFSFLLGDLHAHVMATPFALVAFAIALQTAVYGPVLPDGRGRLVRAASAVATVGLVLGALYAVNTVDFPTALLLVLGGLLLWVTGPGRRRVAAVVWFVVAAAFAILLFAPFVEAFEPDTRGVALVREHEPFTELVWEVVLIYGLPLWVIATAFVGRLGPPTRYLAWAAVGLLIVLVLLAPEGLAGLCLLSVAVAAALHAALDTDVRQVMRFFWLVVALGLALIAVGDFAYIRDAFEGTESYRFNTVFKAGYQAWFLLAIAAAWAAAWNASWLGRRALLVSRVGLALLVVAGLAYPVAGSYSRTFGFSRTPTLDGMRWLDERAPGDAAAIEWLRRETDGAPTVLETVGADFSSDGHARVSTFTGLPTVVGWVGHELQWGHDPGDRAEHVQTIYRTRDLRLARSLLRRYDVEYVFVGSLERKAYPAAALAKFTRLGRRVFSRDGTTVYAVAGGSASGTASVPSPAR